MTAHVVPDYRGAGLLNLIASCTAACGGAALHPTLEALPPAQLAPARNIVLLIIDGLGYNYLTSRGAGGALAARLAERLTSVFPSTTASAITSTFTGLAPAEHGLTGWWTWFPEVDAVIAPLPFKVRGKSVAPAELGITPACIYRGVPLFDALDADPFIVSFRPIIDSSYNQHFCGRATRLAYDNLAALVTQVEATVKSGSQRKFVYAYTPEFDAISHPFGAGSPQAAAVFAMIDAAYADLSARLAGTETALIVTADHGFIDCPAEHAFDLDTRAEIKALLRQPLSGERRIAFCHVLPGREAEFAARAAQWLGDRADVRVSRELLDAGWFGDGLWHPQIAARIGEVALVMRDTCTVRDWLPGEPRHLHIGNHGGLSADEMYIPLVYASV